MNRKAIAQIVKISADADGNAPARIHLMSTGHWHAPWHGNFEMTPDDLAEMVQNFNDGVGVVKGSNKLPINYGHDVSGKAAGWITALSVEANGKELWGDVEWTPEGDRMLREGSFRYISPEWNPRSFPYQDPEDEDSWLDNVFTGAGLTNIPLFKKLKPLMASLVAPKVKQASVVNASDNKPNGEPSMDLEALRAKKPEDLNDEEKSFVSEHKADLTDDERKTFGLEDKPTPPAGDPAPVDDPAGDPAPTDGEADTNNPQPAGPVPTVSASTGQVSITASELSKLKADAAAGLKASQELEESKAKGIIASAVKKGQIKTGDSEGWTKALLASGAQRPQLEKLLAGLPVNESLGKEIGDGGSVEASATAELAEKASKLVSESAGKLTYTAAIKQITASDSDLRDRINAERTNQSK